MPRETFVFYCEGGCRGYVTYAFDTDIAGDYIFRCPHCRHDHYRTVKGGEITSIRHAKISEDAGAIVIEPTLAAYSKTNPIKAVERKGLIGSLWADRFAGRQG